MAASGTADQESARGTATLISALMLTGPARAARPFANTEKPAQGDCGKSPSRLPAVHDPGMREMT